MKKAETDWTPRQIKAAMVRAKVSQSAIARHLAVSPQTVSKVVHGIGRSDPVQQAIAKALGKEPVEIWPSIYLRPGGPPKRGRQMDEIPAALASGDR